MSKNFYVDTEQIMSVYINENEVKKIYIDDDLVFEKGSSGRLPSEYQEVEYIGTSGTQYIDTGWGVDKSNGRIEYKAFLGKQPLASGSYEYVFSNTDSLYLMFILQSKDQSYTKSRYYLGFVARKSIGTFENLILDEGFIGFNETTVNYKINNTTGTYTPTSSFLSTTNILLFSNSTSQNDRMFTGLLYYFNIYEGDEKVREFVPCYRKSDEEIGLYDLVNDVFYTNQGTGTFTKGADV